MSKFHHHLPLYRQDILERIGALYAVEAEVRGLPPDVRRRARLERSRPLVDALREILDAAPRRLSPKSDMAKAIAYGSKRRPALCRFLDDGRLEIDNNIAERYTYDMGDTWHHNRRHRSNRPCATRHQISALHRRPRRGPPEDCGGTPGFENFLNATTDAKHPDHAGPTNWYAGCYGGTYDPETIDDLVTRLRIGDIAKRRAAGKAAHAKRPNS